VSRTEAGTTIPAVQDAIGAGSGDGRPFRLGFLLHLDNDLPPARAYRDAIELFRVAENLGYDSGWVIHRHFRQGNEHVSAPLVVLAAIAEHTSRIALGTGVYVLPLEDPLVVAEAAATLDELSGGRLQLGVGSGPFPGAWEAFAKDLSDRHQSSYDCNVCWPAIRSTASARCCTHRRQVCAVASGKPPRPTLR
jgi:hypothetical protein